MVDLIAVSLLVVGVILLALELVHPGALLLIPATVLLVAGLMWAIIPSELESPVGAAIVVVSAIVAALIEIPYYRRIAPVHPPMSTTVDTLVGQQGVVVTAVVPNSLQGKVRLGTEIWSAQADRQIPEGTPVKVVKGEGVSVTVEPTVKP